MTWLVIARGVSGAGAGGVVPMVWIITGEVVPTEDRAKWSDTLTCVWAASALAGPLLGGVFSGESFSPEKGGRGAVVRRRILMGLEADHQPPFSFAFFLFNRVGIVEMGLYVIFPFHQASILIFLSSLDQRACLRPCYGSLDGFPSRRPSRK